MSVSEMQGEAKGRSVRYWVIHYPHHWVATPSSAIREAIVQFRHMLCRSLFKRKTSHPQLVAIASTASSRIWWKCCAIAVLSSASFTTPPWRDISARSSRACAKPTGRNSSSSQTGSESWSTQEVKSPWSILEAGLAMRYMDPFHTCLVCLTILVT